MNISLTELIWLSHDIKIIRDDRPKWLRSLPSADDEDEAKYARYHRFFYELVKRHGAESVVEIGIRQETSAAHFACQSAACRVITARDDPAASTSVNDIASRHSLKNLASFSGDSAAIRSEVSKLGTIDVLFIGSALGFERCYDEYVFYRSIVKHGGIIFFDDIHASRDMDFIWEHVTDRKAQLFGLHHTGFGVCQVDTAIVPPKPEAVFSEYSTKFNGSSK